MKKLIMILVLTLIPAILFSQADLEKGKRYLKLGMTYLQADDTKQAENYINKGCNLVSNSPKPSAYWSAVGCEYKGYLEQKEGNYKEAEKNFDLAAKTYKKMITQKDGSPVAIEELTRNLDNIKMAQKSMGGMEKHHPKKENNDGDYPRSGKDRDEFSKYASGDNVLNYDRSKFDEVFYQIPKNVENLSMANCKVKDLYPFYDFTNIKYLNLSNNGIKTIPPGLSKLSQLKYLSLNNNKLKKISVSEFASLKSLKVLDLRNNNLSSGEMFQLVRLLPNTNILMDEYQKVEIEDTEGAPAE
jgi:tetratricopeptide (TPR) repeat protein